MADFDIDEYKKNAPDWDEFFYLQVNIPNSVPKMKQIPGTLKYDPTDVMFLIENENIAILMSGMHMMAASNINSRTQYTAKNKLPPWDIIDYGIWEYDKRFKLADVIYQPPFSTSDCFGGYLMSEKAKSVFEQFNLGLHKFYPFTLRQNEQYYPYYWFMIESDESFSIDYEKSLFYTIDQDEDDDYGKHKTLHPVISREYFFKTDLEFWTRAKGSPRRKYLKPLKIVFKKEFFNKGLDIFAFSTMLRTRHLISRRFMEAFKSNHLTGWNISETRLIQPA